MGNSIQNEVRNVADTSAGVVQPHLPISTLHILILILSLVVVLGLILIS